MSIEMKVVEKCKVCCLYLNKSKKERWMFIDSFLSMVPNCIIEVFHTALRYEGKIKSLELNQHECRNVNDSDIDSDFEDFDSDEESDSELVWQSAI